MSRFSIIIATCRRATWPTTAVSQNLFEIWLEGDHYKWRAMRANGVDERLLHRDRAAQGKISGLGATVPQTLRNPLYHWTHLELKRYFGIEEIARRSERRTHLGSRPMRSLATTICVAQGIMRKFQVSSASAPRTIRPTIFHIIAPSPPAGWPPRCTRRSAPIRRSRCICRERFNAWLAKLEAVANTSIGALNDLVDALRQRHDYFHQMGGRLSDHGLSTPFAEFCCEQEAAGIFARARAGQPANPLEQARFASYLMLVFGRLDAEKGWTKQLHLGARRNNNTRRFRELGPDVGFDSIGDWPQGDALGAYLDRLDEENALPKIVVYNLNPADNYLVATMMGNFQDGSIAGKMQYGSSWWFLDQKEAMEWQMNALSNCGLISRFIGMLTDSRSFLSYPRHEYFRRTLCGLFGADMEAGLLPNDYGLVGETIRRICFENAREFLGLEGV